MCAANSPPSPRKLIASTEPAVTLDVYEQPKVADAVSELLQDLLGKDKSACRFVYGVETFRSAPRSSWKRNSRGDHD
jgi:hypothetical protein